MTVRGKVDMYISVAPFDNPVGSFVGEGHKRLIIDIAAGPPAPGNEVSGSYLGLDGPDALVIEAFEVLLRSGFPFSVDTGASSPTVTVTP
ncbi:hypothetical protein LOK82_14045 [Xylella fastidiosa subsp. multiplex]|uniref:Uncharacterized protein n=2 Tax=Xylella fastidiosa TaxID=2371 RepID=A0AAW6HZY8_XYLFS|nr:hypothetical protein [Xylella fastidiosa subsp. multiplex]MDC6409665.1 hypothetical protein [Xylella fastidiosa subsp. multiplex]